MTAALLLLAALAALPLSPAPASASAKAPARSSFSVEACRKACMVGHDAHVLTCKTVLANKEQPCLNDAEKSRARCDADCAKPPKPAKPSKKKASSSAR